MASFRRQRSHGVLDGENMPLMAKTQSGSRALRMKHHLNAQIDTRRADIILIICFLVSGLTDAGAYNAWQVFLSMQTGNTIFAALGISNLPTNATVFEWLKSLTAIAAFILGALFFSTLHRVFSPRRRWVLILSFFLQTIFIITSAILIQSGSASDDSPKKPESPPPTFGTTTYSIRKFSIDLIPIALLSFQASGKVVASRVLEYSALPTIVLTVLFTDLVSDPSFFSGGLFRNGQRNRMLGGLTFYFAGAVLGGVFASTVYGFAGALWFVAAVKGMIICAWVVWWEKTGDEDEY